MHFLERLTSKRLRDRRAQSSGEDRKRTTVKSSGETESFKVNTAAGAAVHDSALLDPDLQRIVEAWPALPEDVRGAMLALLS